MVKVLLADSQPMILSGLHEALDALPNVNVVGETTQSDEISNLVESLQPDILVIDSTWPGIRLLALLTLIVAVQSPPKVLVFGRDYLFDDILELFEVGVRGWVMQSEDLSMLTKALEAVANGGTYRSPEATLRLEQALRTTPAVGLSEREMEVVKLVAQGLSNADIAAKLSIGEGTVKNHVSAIRRKLKLHSRNAITAWAWQEGVATKPDEKS